MQLSAIIPAYNEVEHVDSWLDEVSHALRGRFDFEIVVVDDGSTDTTFNCLTELRRDTPQLKVVRHRCNFGQSARPISGVKNARTRLIDTLDGDGQSGPADILALFERTIDVADDGATVPADGNRQKHNDSWLRCFSLRVTNVVRQRLFKDDCLDIGRALKIFSGDIFLMLPHFNHLHRLLPAPVNHRSRKRGQSKYGVWNRLWIEMVDLFGVMRLQWRPCRPEWGYESE